MKKRFNDEQIIGFLPETGRWLWPIPGKWTTAVG